MIIKIIAGHPFLRLVLCLFHPSQGPRLSKDGALHGAQPAAMGIISGTKNLMALPIIN